MDISVIIATFNRCFELDQLLNKLEEQTDTEYIKWEILVIDNGSSDNTMNVCEKYMMLDPLKIRYYFEKSKGKSKALNQGIHLAKGEILAFTDDDCIPDKTWICSVANEFKSDQSISVIGGRVELYNKLDWDITTVYHNNKMEINDLHQLFPPLIIGCNMAIKRQVIRDVGCFDPLLGPGSKINAISEDVDILYRIIKNGYKVVYSPKVLVLHNHGKREKKEIIALVKNYYRGQGAFYIKHLFNIDIIRNITSSVYNNLKSLLKGIITGNLDPYKKVFLTSLLLGAIKYQTIKKR
jgi:hypothetical protein